MCNTEQYVAFWFGQNAICLQDPVHYGEYDTCWLKQSYWCGTGLPSADPVCQYATTGGCSSSDDCNDKPNGCASWDTSANCTKRGQATDACGAGSGNGLDDNFNGCADEGCTAGRGACTCTKRCSSYACTPPTPATCDPFKQFAKEICFDHEDNNCNGQVDEGCAPKDACEAKAGKDPILLASQSAVTEPFTDFEVEFVSKLGLTRTYTSASASIQVSAQSGAFGRGWHHDWEAGLQCDAEGVCTAWRGLAPGERFMQAGSVTSPDGLETWVYYEPYSTEVLTPDHHDVLLWKPSGSWEWHRAGGSVLVFETICEACGGQSSCPDADAGIARLVRSIDPTGNSVWLRYDRPSGLVLRLEDDLGHALELRGDGTCPSRATELRLDGVLVATYSYVGQDLARVSDADGLTMRSYSYDLGNAGLLRGVKNGQDEILAEFSYDASGRAIGLVDDASSIAIDYDAQDGVAVTEAFRGKDGETTSRSARTLNQDGRVVSMTEGCACGPAKTQEYSDRQLTCSRDALGHVTRHYRDPLGRVTRTVRFPGTSCTTPATLPAGSTDEYRTYGLTRQLAQGVLLDLDSTLTDSRRGSTGAGGWATDTYDHDPAPNSMDPPGYRCTTAPLPVGSVVCRQLTSGWTFVETSTALRNERHATFYTYDARGRVIRTYGPVNLDVVSATDVPPLEERTYWADDASPARRGRLHEVRRYARPEATPLVTAYDYDAFGVFQLVDERGAVTTIVKDGRGRARYVIAPNGVTETRYHEGSSPRLMLLAGGGVRRYAYDGMGRVQAIEHLDGDPDAQAVTVAWSEHFAYDSAGNRVHEERRDRTGTITWQVDRGFDVQHRVVWESNPEQPDKVRSWTYDAAGALSGTADELGRSTTFVPDTMGRVQKVQRAAPSVTPLEEATYTYQKSTNDIGKVVGGNRQGGNYGTAAYAYDDFGRLYQLNSHSIIFGTQNFWYDARGNLVRKRFQWTPAETRNATYTYDGLDRITSMTAGPVTYQYEYDAQPFQGLLTSVQEPDRFITYAYDAAGRITSESVLENGASAPLVTSYAYDAGGRVSEVTYPSGLRVQYDRDPATGEIVRVSDVVTGVRYADAVTHVPFGPVNGLAFGNGARLDASYNKRHEPVAIATGPLALGYGMNAAGDVELLSDQSLTLSGPQDVSRTFTYDFLDRLQGSPSWIGYAYDGAGNRTVDVVDGVQSTYTTATESNVPRLDTVQHRKVGIYTKHSFMYDRRGNVTGLANWSTTYGGIAYCLIHDDLGRLVTVGKGGYPFSSTLNGTPVYCLTESQITQLIARFKYDSANRRIARQNAATGQWTYVIHDTAGHPLSELALVGGSWVKVRDYVWLDDQPIAQIQYPGPTSDGGYVYYLHTDHIGLPRAMTNATGQLVWSASTRPYGELEESTTTDPLSGSVVVTNLRLPGQYDERLLGTLGLQGPYYNRNRWYLPGVGRYLEPDPIAMAGGFNGEWGPDWYSYANGNPLRYTDPTGEAPVPDWLDQLIRGRIADWLKRFLRPDFGTYAGVVCVDEACKDKRPRDYFMALQRCNIILAKEMKVPLGDAYNEGRYSFSCAKLCEDVSNSSEFKKHCMDDKKCD